eukprot:COSAG04_NODE_361_length_15860_cov_18.114904_5_plen_113_part_00
MLASCFDSSTIVTIFIDNEFGCGCLVQAALKYNLAGKGEHMEKAKMDAYKQYRQQAKVKPEPRPTAETPPPAHSRTVCTVNAPRKCLLSWRSAGFDHGDVSPRLCVLRQMAI